MNEHFAKTAIVRLIGILVAKVPFAENSCCIASLLQQLRKRSRIQRHPLALIDGVRDAIA
jgi:hypothetical protein